MIEYKNFQFYFFLILLLGVAVLTILLFAPYLNAVLLAATLAVIFYPLYKNICTGLRKFIKTKRQFPEIISSLITLLIVIFIILGPLSIIGIQLFGELRQLYSSLSGQEKPFFSQYVEQIEKTLGIFIPNFSENINTYIKQAISWMSQHIGSVFTGVGKAFVTLFLSMLAFYYLLKDGKHLKAFIVKISPLPDTDDEKIMIKLKQAVNSVIRGSLMIAIIQGFLTGIGFTIFGVPNATLWGSIAAISALIPSIGTSLILIPGILFLLLTGNTFGAVGLSIWSLSAVGTIDNILGPYLMRQGLPIHPFVILLAVLGGITMFGPIGFLIGPLIVSLLFALFDIYAEHMVNLKKKA